MGNCSECTYLKANDPDLYGKYWCEQRLERVAAYESCDRFCKAYSRSYSDSKDYEKYSKDHSGNPGCYLTTMLCNILEMPDDNIYLKTMRNFRNNILQNDKKYKKLLVEYDIVGPRIAHSLKNDPLKYQTAFNAFLNYIVPITDLIKSKENDNAVKLYTEMTNRLKLLYNTNDSIDISMIENADIKQSGHGNYKVKKIALR